MAAFIPAAITAAGSIAGGYLANRGTGRTSKMEQTKGQLVDQLLASLKGNGPYSSLFETDDNAFQKGFVDPAKNIFQNQIAPQIQQSYINAGQQRGSGVNDALTRAGVDLDQILNQHYFNYQQGGQNRQANAINAILGGSNGTQPAFSNSDALAQAGSGYLQNPAFGSAVKDIFSPAPNPQANMQQNQPHGFEGYSVDQPRKGFAADWRNWKNMPVGDPRWAGG